MYYVFGANFLIFFYVLTLIVKIKDFEKLLEVSKQGKNIAIVGGGFLGSELACALAYNSKKYGGKVTQVFPEAGNLNNLR